MNNHIVAVALISFKEGLRQRVLYGMLIFSLLLIAFSVLASGLFMRDIDKITIDFCLTAVSLGGLLVPFFLAVNLLARDLERRTVYSLLARAISRREYILGKFGGLALITTTIVGILSCASIIAIAGSKLLYAGHFFADFRWSAVLIALAACLFGLLMFNAVVIFWSSVTTSSFLVTLLTLATYLVGQTMEDLVRFMSIKIPGVEHSPLVQKSVQVALYIFPNLAAFDLKLAAAHGLIVPFKELFFLTVYGASYTVAALCLAILFFQKRDLV